MQARMFEFLVDVPYLLDMLVTLAVDYGHCQDGARFLKQTWAVDIDYGLCSTRRKSMDLADGRQLLLLADVIIHLLSS